jgi:hypothetical protein
MFTIKEDLPKNLQNKKKNIYTKENLLSKYHTIYFGTKFSDRNNAMNKALLTTIVMLVISVGLSVLIKDKLIINLLLPFTYIGIAGSIYSTNFLKKDLKSDKVMKEESFKIKKRNVV